PLSVGAVGYYMGPNGATRHLRTLVEDADVILLIGNRTNQNGTDSWKLYPPTAQYIHIDIDGLEVGRNYEAIRVVGDARLALAALHAQLTKENLSGRRDARPALEATIKEGKTKFLEESEAVRSATATPIRPERIMQELNMRLTRDAIVV